MKIIWISNIYSEFSSITQQITNIANKNGRFDIILLTGYVFKEDKGIAGLNELSLSFKDTIILILDISPIGIIIKHNHEEYEKENIKNKIDYLQYNSNVYILKNSGVMSIHNLNIAYIQGYESPEMISPSYSSKFNNKIYHSGYFNENDLKRIYQSTEKIDILLSNSLPQHIFYELNNTKFFENKELLVQNDILLRSSSSKLNILCNILSPRYILLSSGEDFFFERQVFLTKVKCDENEIGYLSRVIHLSTYNNPKYKKNLKEKFIYAVNIEPMFTLNSFGKKIFNDKIVYLNEALDEISIKHSDNNNPFTIYNDNSYHIDDVDKSNQSKEIYIGNIDYSTKYNDLYEFLQKFGDIDRLIYPQKDEKFLGYAFIIYVNNQEIHDSILNLNNRVSLNGRKLIFNERVLSNKQTSVLSNDLNNNKSTCWFCIENPKIDMKYVININLYTSFYVAIPKGGINEFHFLVIPKSHLQSTSHLSVDDKNELMLIINKIIAYLKSVSCEDVMVYEKLLPFSNYLYKHLIVNIVGIGKDYLLNMKENILKSTSEFSYRTSIVEGINESIGGMFIKDNEFKQKNKYFYNLIYPSMSIDSYIIFYSQLIIEIPNDNKENSDLIRKIICLLINKKENINWKNSNINISTKTIEEIKEYFNNTV